MTPITPTSSLSPERYKIVRKRNRVPLSCRPCRLRKLKCNRAKPCEHCIRKQDEESCIYELASNPKKSGSLSSDSPIAVAADGMQDRIDRLENLVLSLMTSGSSHSVSSPTSSAAAATAALAQAQGITLSSTNSSSSGSVKGSYMTGTDEMLGDETSCQVPEDREVTAVANSIGVLKVDGSKSFFVSEAHWFSLLAEITEVKTFFSEHKSVYEEQYKRMAAKNDETGSNGLFFFSYPQASRTEVMRSFPPRATTDVLIGRFFDFYNQDPTFQIIHGPTYQKQYDQYWTSPNDVDVIWLGLSYAMMMVALVSYELNGDEPLEYQGQTDLMYRDYRRLAAQCLMQSDFYKIVPYLLEVLIFCIMADLKKSPDAQQKVMLGVTLLTRHALKMGYHRDPKYFNEISPFVGEMRRRVWAIVKEADLSISAQFGLPPIIRPETCNTDLPRNLYDDELDEHMTDLAASRSLAEPTPIAYMIYKTQLIDVTYEIVQYTQSLAAVSYDKAMELDRKLRQVREDIPPQYRFRAFDDSPNEAPHMIAKRYILDTMFHKHILLLQRKFCSSGKYPYSARVSIDSAITILKHQDVLYSQSQPGRHLADTKVFLSSVTSHDYLMAAMVIAISLYTHSLREKNNQPSCGFIDESGRKEMLATLEGSYRIWSSQKENSMEAFKATGILMVLLQTLYSHKNAKRKSSSSPSSLSSATVATPLSTNGFISNDPNNAADLSATMSAQALAPSSMSPTSFTNPQNTISQPKSSSSSSSLPQTLFNGPSISQFKSMNNNNSSSNGAFYNNDMQKPMLFPTTAQGPSPIPFLFGSQSIFQPFTMTDTDALESVDWDSWDKIIAEPVPFNSDGAFMAGTTSPNNSSNTMTNSDWLYDQNGPVSTAGSNLQAQRESVQLNDFSNMFSSNLDRS